jgi:hypothetical protein
MTIVATVVPPRTPTVISQTFYRIPGPGLSDDEAVI